MLLNSVNTGMTAIEQTRRVLHQRPTIETQGSRALYYIAEIVEHLLRTIIDEYEYSVEKASGMFAAPKSGSELYGLPI